MGVAACDLQDVLYAARAGHFLHSHVALVATCMLQCIHDAYTHNYLLY